MSNIVTSPTTSKWQPAVFIEEVVLLVVVEKIDAVDDVTVVVVVEVLVGVVVLVDLVVVDGVVVVIVSFEDISLI